MELKEISKGIYNVDSWLDEEYGKVGTSEREEFRKEAYVYCVVQMIYDARKKEGMTQLELAKKVGTNRTYISRKEKGLIEPGVVFSFVLLKPLDFAWT